MHDNVYPSVQPVQWVADCTDDRPGLPETARVFDRIVFAAYYV